MNIKKYSFIVAISLFLPTKLNLYGSDLGILQEKLGDDSYTEVYKRVVFCNASCASLLSNIKKDGTKEVYYILRIIKETLMALSRKSFFFCTFLLKNNK